MSLKCAIVASNILKHKKYIYNYNKKKKIWGQVPFEHHYVSNLSFLSITWQISFCNFEDFACWDMESSSFSIVKRFLRQTYIAI